MNTVIDHAILITASPQAVWSIISKVENNPKWQADCESVSFLNNRREGQGTRWRYQSSSGREIVAEITAWYDGLGYEYVIVDGTSYQNKNRGRIRLQETAEGTVVQWTFSYDISGFLGGLRNNLTLRRSVDADIVNSLRNLFAYMRTLNQEDFNNAKATMRDAPDVTERSAYKPKYPTVLDEHGNRIPKPSTQPIASDQEFRPPVTEKPIIDKPLEHQKPMPIVEPPVSDEDTKPNPTVQVDEVSQSEPSFLNDLPESTGIEDHQRFAPPPRAQEPIEPPASTTQQTSRGQDAQPADEFDVSPLSDSKQRETLLIQIQESPLKTPAAPEKNDTQETATALTETEPSPAEINTTSPVEVEESADSVEPVVPQPPAVEEDRKIATQEAVTPAEAPASPAQTNESTEAPGIRDTSQISVFDLFGLSKPSATQEMRMAQAQSKSADSISDAQLAQFISGSIQPDVSPDKPRSGLRAKLRQQLAKVRHP